MSGEARGPGSWGGVMCGRVYLCMYIVRVYVCMYTVSVYVCKCIWETDFYTPQVLGGAALFDNSAPAVYKIQGP